MNQRDWINDEKRKLARIKRSRCYICNKKYGKGFAFHHLWYDGNEPDYKADKYSYYSYVFKQIRDRPQQFALLCKPCHYLIDRRLKWMDASKMRRVREIWKKSRVRKV